MLFFPSRAKEAKKQKKKEKKKITPDLRLKTAQQMAQAKERGEGGKERKQTLADKAWNFENCPLGLSCLSSRTDI